MAGIKGKGGAKGRSGAPAGVPRAAGGGRKPTSATLQTGRGVMLSQVRADSTADLGRGVISRVERLGRDRVVVVPQTDGSEVRIVVLAPDEATSDA